MVRGTVGTCLGYHDHQLRVPGAGSVKVASTLLNAEILNGKHTVDTQDTPVTQRPRVRTCKDLLCVSPRGNCGK